LPPFGGERHKGAVNAVIGIWRMPALIVVVLREPTLADQTADALSKVGYDAIAMSDAMVALRALETASSVELLITSADFPDGQPNGLALARMTRLKRPKLKVIFANGPETKPHLEKNGLFIPTPTTAETLAEAAAKMLAEAA
jgi:DNA-binding NtrC family response regulator